MPTWLAKLFQIVAGLILSIFFGLVVFCLVLFIGVQFGSAYVSAIMGSSILIFFTAVIIHEGGHLLAALVACFRILLFAVGGLGVLRTRNGFQLRGIGRSLKLTGVVIALPAREIISRPRMVLFISGGSLANLFTASLCFWGAFELNGTVTASYPPRSVHGWDRMLIPQNRLACSLSIAGLVNLFLVHNLLIPIRWRGHSSDAAQLLDLFRNRHGGGAGWLVTFLRVALRAGIRPRDWDAPAVERLLAMRSGTTKDVSANVLAYYYAMDTGQIELAGQLINLAVSQRQVYPVANQSGILQEAAFFEARFRHNSTAAREWLRLAQETNIEPQMRPRAEAAILLAEGRYAEAAAKAQEAISLLPRSADPGGKLAETNWLRDILDECQKEMAQATKPQNLAAP